MRRKLAALLLLVPLAAIAQDRQDDERGFFGRLFGSEEDGPGFLEGLLEDSLSGAGREVDIVGFEGALSSRAMIEELTIADDQGVWLTMRDVVLDWNRSAILRRNIDITELSAAEILLPRLPQTEPAGPAVPPAEAQGFSLPELPVAIAIEEVQAGRVVLGEPLFGEEAVVEVNGGVRLAGGEGAVDLGVERIDEEAGALTLEAAYSNATQELAIDLALTEGPDGIVANLIDLPERPSLELVVDGQGPISDFAADIALDTAGVERLAGEVRLTGVDGGEAGAQALRFEVDLGGDIAPVFLPEYRDFFGPDVQLQAAGVRFPDGRLELETLDLDAGALTLSGEVAIGADGLPDLVDVQGRIADAGGEPVLLPLSGPQTRVQSATVDLAFDASESDDWDALIRLEDLDRGGFSAESLTLEGTGRIATEPAEDGEVRVVTAALDFAAQSLDLGDPGAAQALGEAVTGAAEIVWREGQPVRLDLLQVEGESYALEAEATIDGLDSALTVDGRATLRAEDLSAFSGLAGQPLDGSASLTIAGQGEVLAGRFDLAVDGTTENLSIGQERIDPLLGGTGTLSVRAARDETGTEIETLSIETEAATISGEGRLASGESRLVLDARIDEVGLLDPGLTGAATVSAVAEEDAAGWSFDVAADVPGGDLAAAGRVTGLGESPVVTGTLSVQVADLEDYSELVGRPLAGRLEATAQGRAGFDLREVSVDLVAAGQDLALGLPDVDPLLRGPLELALNATRDGDTARIDALRLDGEAIAATGEGVVENLDATPVFIGEVQVTAADLSAFSGIAGRELAGAASAELDGRLAFDLSAFDVAATATATDLDPGLPGLPELLEGQTTLVVGASRDGDAVVIDTLRLDAQEIAADVAGRLTGLGSTPVFDGRASVRAADLAPLSELAGRDLAGAASAELDGRLAIDLSAFDVTATATATDLDPGLPGLPELLEGQTTLVVDASRDGDAVVIETFRLDAQEIGADVAGRLTGLGSTPVFDGRASVRAADLAPLSELAGRDLAGALEADVRGTAALDGSQFDLEADVVADDLNPGVAAASGPLQGRTTLSASASRDGDVVTIERFDLDGPALTANASGVLSDLAGTPAFDGEIELAADDLSVFSDLAGRSLDGTLEATAEGQVSTDLATVDLVVGATGQGLDFGLPGAAALLPGEVTFALEAGRGGEQVLIRRFSLDSGNLTASASGALSGLDGTPVFDGQVAVAADDLAPLSPFVGQNLRGAVDAEASGVLGADLERFDLAVDLTAQNLGIGVPDIDRLFAGTTTLNLDAAREDGSIVVRSAELDAAGLDLSGAGRLSDAITVSVRLADVAPYAPGLNGPVTVRGTAALTGETIAVDLAANGPGGVGATVDGTIRTSFDSVDLDVEGQAPLVLANRFLAPRSIAGTLRFDLAIDGAPALENVSGLVSTDDARFVAPRFGLVLENIDLDGRLAAGNLVLDATAAVQDGGQVAISGPLSLQGQLPADLSVVLQNVRLVDPELYETRIDGQLSVDGPLRGGARIGGEIVLGRTELRIPAGGFGSAGAIPDIIHVNEPSDVRATRERAGVTRRNESDGGQRAPAFPLNITVRAENQIFVRGRGLDAELGGQIQLLGTSRDIQPAGQFDLIRGRLDILGERLILDEGFARLQGDFVPFVRLVAETDAEEVTVFVIIEGSLREPDIDFQSAPQLPDDEILARLLFGRDISTISAFQAAQLANAVATLAGGGLDIAGGLRESFGLDDFDVTTDEGGNAAFRAGKYLTDNIYTDVTVDAEGETQLNLNFDLSRSVTVKGGVDSEGGTSLGVFFERDY